MRQLYDYHRSSAAYRVRIALRLKNLPYESIPIALLEDAQRSSEYVKKNPQGLVPTLVEHGVTLTQSLAICEYLNEVYPTPPLMPNDAIGKAQVRALAHSIACDIHPLNNLRVLRQLEVQFNATAEQKDSWYRHWINIGFTAFEQQIQSTHGAFCYQDTPSLADICLVPQVYNARRFNVDMAAYPTIVAIEQQCLTLDAFSQTSPDHVQP